MLENFRTLKNDGSHENIIKKSRFIAHLKRTESVAEAEVFIAAVKKEHKDATHNCSAYLIGEQNEFQKAHDDGEPSGTAGVPMLEILKKRQLKNVTAVVTRYFGGIKLGAGGLIRAYGGAVNDAVDALGVVERQLLQEIRVTVDYTFSGKCEHHLRASDLILDDIIYTDKVTYVCYLKKESIAEFKVQMANLTSGTATFSANKQAYVEIPQLQ